MTVEQKKSTTQNMETKEKIGVTLKRENKETKEEFVDFWGKSFKDFIQ